MAKNIIVAPAQNISRPRAITTLTAAQKRPETVIWRKVGIVRSHIISFGLGAIVAFIGLIFISSKNSLQMAKVKNLPGLAQTVQLIAPQRQIEIDLSMDLNKYVQVDPNAYSDHALLLADLSQQDRNFEADRRQIVAAYYQTHDTRGVEGQRGLNELYHRLDLLNVELGQHHKNIVQNFHQAQRAKNARQLASK